MSGLSPKFGNELRTGVHQLRGALGTFGYVISRDGAKKTLRVATRSDKPIDHLLDSAIATGKVVAYHVVPPIIQHINDHESSLSYVR